MITKNLDSTSLISMYRQMRLIRRFEERTAELIDAGQIRAHAHLYIGEEAVAVGVSSALQTQDVITSTHRGHGHILAKGGDPMRMFAELMGREAGYNKGRGGSMHIADVGLGIFGANGIVGAGAPMACGAAQMFKKRGELYVAVSFFGDGAINQGVLLESFNIAAIWDLPVVFICENNQYAITSPITEMSRGSLVDRAAAFGLEAKTVDGMDVVNVHEAATRAISRARAGKGPSFLECETYRFEAHNTALRATDLTYRTKEELESWKERDPLLIAAQRLDAEEGWAAEDRAAIDFEVDTEIEEAIARAGNSAAPLAHTALDHMYAQTYPGFPAGVTE